MMQKREGEIYKMKYIEREKERFRSNKTIEATGLKWSTREQH